MNRSVNDRTVCLLSLNYAPETTGIGPYATRLAEIMAELGFRVTVVTAYPHYPSASLFDKNSVAEESAAWKVVRARHFPYTSSNLLLRLLSEVSFGFSAWWAVRRSRFDRVIAVSPSLVGGYLFRLLSNLGGRSEGVFIVWAQDLYGPAASEVAARSSRFNMLVQRVEGRYLRTADKTVVIHEGFREIIQERYGVDVSRIHVQRNWSRWNSGLVGQDRIEEVRRSLGWTNKTVVLHAGNIGAKQSLETMVAAARYASSVSSQQDLMFVAMGDGNRRDEIQRISADLANFTIIEPVGESDFFSVLRSADVLLVCELPTLTSASLPSKLVSYFNAGRPVIVASNKNGLTWTEASRSGVCVHVTPGSARLLAETASVTAEDGSFREFCDAAGPRYAAEVFSESKAASEFAAVLGWAGREGES